MTKSRKRVWVYLRDVSRYESIYASVYFCARLRTITVCTSCLWIFVFELDSTPYKPRKYWVSPRLLIILLFSHYLVSSIRVSPKCQCDGMILSTGCYRRTVSLVSSRSYRIMSGHWENASARYDHSWKEHDICDCVIVSHCFEKKERR